MSNNFKSLNFISHKNNYIIESINIVGSEDDFFYIKKMIGSRLEESILMDVI